MPEVNIDKLTTPKNEVFFPGKAVLSDKAAEAFETAKTEPEVAETEEPTKAKKGK